MFASGWITIPDMAKTGIFANTLGIILMPLWMLLAGVLVFNINVNEVPEWAAVVK